jgi:hypothetical protein
MTGPRIVERRLVVAADEGTALTLAQSSLQSSDVCVLWGALDNTQIGNVFNGGCGSAGAP